MPTPGKLMNVVRLVQGQTKVLELTVKDKDGRPASLSSADIYLTAKKNITDATPALCISTVSGDIVITDAAGGLATITIPSTATDIDVGSYRYDVWVVFTIPDPDIRQPVIRNSELCVDARLGDFSCPVVAP